MFQSTVCTGKVIEGGIAWVLIDVYFAHGMDM